MIRAHKTKFLSKHWPLHGLLDKTSAVNIPILAGVKQSDHLSSILFNIATDPLMLLLHDTGKGVDTPGARMVMRGWDGWMNQAYSRLSTTHGHITDCKLVCMYWTRLVLARPAASLYSASPLKHHPTGKQRCPNPDHYSDSQQARRSLTLLCWALSRAAESQILTSFVWRGRGSNQQPPTCQANAQPLHYPAVASRG